MTTSSQPAKIKWWSVGSVLSLMAVAPMLALIFLIPFVDPRLPVKIAAPILGVVGLLVILWGGFDYIQDDARQAKARRPSA